MDRSPIRCASTCSASRRRCAPTRASGARTRSSTPSPGCCTTSTTSGYPDLGTGHPRNALELFRENGLPAGADRRGRRPRRLPRRPARDADGQDPVRRRRAVRLRRRLRARAPHTASRAWRRSRSRRSSSSRASPPASTATSVRHGAEELGVDFDEHLAFVIAAMEARADELGLAARPRPARAAS